MQVSASKVRETPNGVKYFEITKGEGETPKQGDFVVITYTGCTSCATRVVGVGGLVGCLGFFGWLTAQPHTVANHHQHNHENRPARRDHLRQPARQGEEAAGVQDRHQAGAFDHAPSARGFTGPPSLTRHALHR